MARYSGGAGQASQDAYEEKLRWEMIAVIDIESIPLAALPSPFPKTAAEIAAEQASRQAFNSRMGSCTEATKGLRLGLMADRMQQILDSSAGLSTQERTDFEADIRATRDAAAKGLDIVEPVDPSNPYRAMMRLSTQDQMDIAMQSGQQMAALMMSCAR